MRKEELNGCTLEQIRKAYCLTRVDLQRISGVSKEAVKSVELLQHKTQRGTRHTLAAALGMRVDDIDWDKTGPNARKAVVFNVQRFLRAMSEEGCKSMRTYSNRLGIASNYDIVTKLASHPGSLSRHLRFARKLAELIGADPLEMTYLADEDEPLRVEGA